MNENFPETHWSVLAVHSFSSKKFKCKCPEVKRSNKKKSNVIKWDHSDNKNRIVQVVAANSATEFCWIIAYF